MASRAQIETQTLMYALSGIIAVLLLLFGYVALTDFQEQGDFAQQLVFENSLRKHFASVDYGTDFPVDIVVPASIARVCFVQSFPQVNPISTQNFQLCADPLLRSSVAWGVQKDVFLIEKATGLATASYFVGNLSVSVPLGADTQRCFCVDTATGKASFRLEGLGRQISVRPVE